MARFKVVLTDQVFPDTRLEERMLGEIDAELEIADGSLDDVLARVGDADAVLTTYFPISSDTIALLGQCKIIARYGIGMDNVDVAAAAERGITVTNVPDYSVEEVAAHALAMLLSMLRRLPEADGLIRSGGWAMDALRPIRRLSTLTVGLVGYGRIARRLEASLRSLGMNVIVHDPFVETTPEGPELVELDELLSRSDAVSMHAPLTPDTRNMIAAPQLQQMRDGAVLVNTSRGGLVVLDDVVAALSAGTLRAAALDVFDTEPLAIERIEGVPNLLVSPHMAYYSEEALGESQRKATTQIVKVLSGEEPDYPVRP